MLIRSLKRYRLFLVLALLFIILRLPSLFEPYWYGDEGIYLVLGQAIRHGVTLYRRIHDNKPPTLYYLAAFSQTVFGFRLLLSLWMIPTIYAFYLLCRRFLSRNLIFPATLLFLVLTSIPLFEGNIANAEIFMLLPTLIAVLLIYRTQNQILIILSGLLLGFAFTIKIPVAAEFGFLFLWYLFFSKKTILPKILDLISFSVAFLLPLTLYLAYFVYHNALNEFLFSALLQNFGYLSSWSSGTHSGSATNGGLLTRAVILVFFWIFTYFLTVKKKITKNLGFLCFWFSACVFGALLSTRPYPHYLIQIIPPLSLLILFLFGKNISIPVRRFILVILLVMVCLFAKYRFYVYPVVSYYRNYYSHIFNLNSPEYRQYFGRNVNQTYLVSQYVSSVTSPADKIFIWGDEPYVYALSDRLPASKYTVAYHIVDFNQYQSVYDELKVNFPKLIIYYPQNNRPYPQLNRFISRYYSPAKTFDDTVIFQRLH